MISQLRTYTVNKGQMDQWVKHFNEVLMPLIREQDITLDGVWVSEDKTQFIWIRTFEDAEDMSKKEAALWGTAKWGSIVDYTRSFLARQTVKIMEPVSLEK